MATGRLPDPNSAPVTAKGDLYTYSTRPERLAVGSNGETLVADSSTSTGLRWQGSYAAGKNAIINGDFRIAQRGTSITCAAGNVAFTLDRWSCNRNGSGTVTVTQETFTPGTAPVAGYEGANYLRFNQSVAGTGATFSVIQTQLEDVRLFAGQTVTFSFWAKTAAAKTYSTTIRQNFGTGGSTSVDTNAGSFTTSTSWQRFSFTVTLPSISGKTIGTGSFLNPWINVGLNETTTLDLWGVQFEAGNTATAFQTATGTLAGEFSACQRYYERFDSSADGWLFLYAGYANSTTSARGTIPLQVTKRVSPTVTVTNAGSLVARDGSVNATATAFTIGRPQKMLLGEATLTTTGLTLGRGLMVDTSGNTNFVLEASAEL